MINKNKFAQLFGVFLVSAVCFNAAAATSKVKTPDAPLVDESYTVTVQQSAVHIDGSDVSYRPIVADWEFAVSNWSPYQLSRPSLIASDANFQTGSLPSVSISRLRAFAFYRQGVLESVMGLQAARVNRSGAVGTGAILNTTQEKLNVASLKLGVSYRLPSLGSAAWQPSLELDLMPTWISSETSAFEQYGVNALGVLGMAELKLMYCPQFMQATYGQQTGEGFGVAYLATTGSAGGSNLTGGGLQGILRMAF